MRKTSQDSPSSSVKTIKETGPAAAVRSILGIQNMNSPVEQRWEELENIYHECAQGIVSVGQSVQEAITVPGVKENIENTNEVKIAVTGLMKDLNRFTDDLLKIHKFHEGKTGVIKSDTDLITSLRVFELYTSFTTQFQSVTMPAVTIIMDHVGAAVQAIAKRLAEENATESTTDKKDSNELN